VKLSTDLQCTKQPTLVPHKKYKVRAQLHSTTYHNNLAHSAQFHILKDTALEKQQLAA